jgi:DNA-binding transcriptional ArsR family regulator
MTRSRKQRPRLGREALELVAQRFRALGDPTRLALLQALFDGERTVQELCELTGASQANASKHLALLADQGLVARRKDGQYVRCSLADPSVHELCEVVCGSLARRFEAIREQLGP